MPTFRTMAEAADFCEKAKCNFSAISKSGTGYKVEPKKPAPTPGERARRAIGASNVQSVKDQGFAFAEARTARYHFETPKRVAETVTLNKAQLKNLADVGVRVVRSKRHPW